ncbi:hypothetical protein [Demequina iriomotensis]|uniref:hypothetical protein n=1 Tax=Demequina iriomotensis TaxID=1536641 RepID=UPI000783B400|nr:hypothetical protein [Demequina iriomotensis]
MSIASRLMSAASLALRIVLALGALFVASAAPEQLDTWRDPAASTLPTEHTMPYAANYLLPILMLATAGALIAGWWVRRGRMDDAAGDRAVGRRLWRASAWIAAIGMVPWIAALATSQWIASQPDDGVIGMGFPGPFVDAAAAIPAVAALVILARDLRTAPRPDRLSDSRAHALRA